mgnify:CR=1 FL=1
MKRSVIITAAAAIIAVSQPVLAKGDIAAGKEKSTLCVACHGADGNSPTLQFPRIAGQHADYLKKSLEEYKSGARNNPIMLGIASQLSEEDMENLSAFFAAQKGPLTTLSK